ncbi:hypothetical protein [Streptomyces sp. NPDC018031]|uniref:hypothetical protein n=1 Tax=Streptomyces sp. NPDC018031 TaxID=3365033 RepID=UPI0037A0C69B
MDLESRTRAARLAPLKEGLAPSRRALAEDLRQVFLLLEVSVRRYATRRHLDASTVTRYLNGERVPPWDFAATLVADVREAGAPITFEAETALRDLHRTALASNRRSSEVQTLQDRLEQADEETRRIKTRQRALEEALLNREARLMEARGRCRDLEVQLEGQRLAHRAELEVWRGEYERLETECEDLQEQVHYLQEALAVARAELIAAEEQCQRLENELETAQRHEPDGGTASSLMAALEAADRTASVPELVAVVGSLESRTQRAMASELVTSVSRSRSVQEVAALLAALRHDGYHAYTETVLPALVMMRSADDTSALTATLHAAGFEECVVTVLRASVELHTAEDLAGFARALERAGVRQHAETLVKAAAAVRPVADVLAVLAALTGTELDPAVGAAVGLVADKRDVPGIADLSIALRTAGLHRLAHDLQEEAAARRSAPDVADLVEALSRSGLAQDADTVFRRAQDRTVDYLIALTHALRRGGRHHEAAAVLERALGRRPAAEVAALIADLYGTGRHQQATGLLSSALHTLPYPEIAALFAVLDETYQGSRAILETAARSSSPQDAAAMVVRLELGQLPGYAEVVFEYTLHKRPVGHAGLFLRDLHHVRSGYTDAVALLRRARAALPSAMAPLMLALDSVSLDDGLDAVVRGSAVDCVAGEAVLLLRNLRALDGPLGRRADRVAHHVLHRIVHARPIPAQVDLVLALEAAGLTRDAGDLAAQATALNARQFTGELKRARTRHEQKVLSRSFWQKQRDRAAD